VRGLGRLAISLLALAGCSSPAAPTLPVAASSGVSALKTAASPTEPPPVEEDLPGPPASTETVSIKLVADARRQAHVFWGRKDLGLAPLEVTRPRGSGPLDLLVVAPGTLPLHTRVFTDRSETLALRLYSEKEATGLLGGLVGGPLGWKGADPAEPRHSKPLTETASSVRPKGKPRPPP
jgi:hypothetical protein